MSDGTPWRPLVHIEDISMAAIAAVEARSEIVHKQAFNVGLNSENYQMRQLRRHCQRHCTRCDITFATRAEPDKRNYRVDFRKFARAFPEHRFRWNVKRGAEQIYDSYRTFGLKRDEYEGPKYKRIAQITSLLSSGQLDKTLRWRA